MSLLLTFFPPFHEAHDSWISASSFVGTERTWRMKVCISKAQELRNESLRSFSFRENSHNTYKLKLYMHDYMHIVHAFDHLNSTTYSKSHKWQKRRIFASVIDKLFIKYYSFLLFSVKSWTINRRRILGVVIFFCVLFCFGEHEC